VLSGRRLEAVYVSEFRRTRDTGTPAADGAGLTPIVVEARDVEGLARAIREGDAGTTLVVGHSNTVPAVIAALGAPPVPDIPESAYDDLYVVTLSPQGGADVVRLKYGAPTPPE
jgi:broad specificity phosphatase PhoE